MIDSLYLYKTGANLYVKDRLAPVIFTLSLPSFWQSAERLDDQGSRSFKKLRSVPPVYLVQQEDTFSRRHLILALKS